MVGPDRSQRAKVLTPKAFGIDVFQGTEAAALIRLFYDRSKIRCDWYFVPLLE